MPGGKTLKSAPQPAAVRRFPRPKLRDPISPPSTEPQLRYRLGDRVLCTIKHGVRSPGVVQGTNVKGNAYLVCLDTGNLIYAPKDVSGYIIKEDK